MESWATRTASATVIFVCISCPRPVNSGLYCGSTANCSKTTKRTSLYALLAENDTVQLLSGIWWFRVSGICLWFTVGLQRTSGFYLCNLHDPTQLVLPRVYYFDFRKPEIPTWAGGVDEIFLYSWQYTSPTSKMHTDVIAILAIYLPMRSTEEAKRIITKVVVDEKIARGILYPIYYRLEQCYTTSARILSDSLICLQYILYFSPILRNVAAKDARFFRTVTSACQYSICSTEDSNHRMACLQEGFLAIL